MRIDYRSGENTDLTAALVEIWLNGEPFPTPNVFLADEEAGEIGFYLPNDEGRVYLDPEDPTHAAWDFVHGDVEIRPLTSEAKSLLAERRENAEWLASSGNG